MIERIRDAARLVFKDWIGLGEKPVYQNDAHLRAAAEWIARAQDATHNGGVSRGYSVLNGSWSAAYPETTGYIIPSIFNYSKISGNKEYFQRAIKMADWEVSIQMENGAYQSGSLELPYQEPSVFNTGQVLFGLTCAYRETGHQEYRKAAELAAGWLIENQDEDGAWRKHLSALTTGTVHVYNTRTAWGLLETFNISSDEKYLNAAAKNARWALTQQLENGWFSNAGFNINEIPITHTLAYTIEGLLECGIYLKEKKLIDASDKSGNALLKVQREDGSLFGRYNSRWENTVKWSCLTGNAQISVIWLKLFEVTGNSKYMDGAMKINRLIKSQQRLESNNEGIRGGIKGSHPIYGGYGPFFYPNWAAKFFMDALMLEEQLKEKTTGVDKTLSTGFGPVAIRDTL